MELLTNILGQFMGVGVLAVLILFQKRDKEISSLYWKDKLHSRQETV